MFLNKIQFSSKILVLLNFTNRKLNFFLILFLALIGAMFELLGISLFIPLISLISENNFSENYFKYLPDFFLELNAKGRIKFILLILIFIYLSKFIYLLILNYIKESFVKNMSFELSNKILASYLNYPISFFIDNNSSKLLNNIQGEIPLIVNGIVSSFLTFLIDVILLFLILLFLFQIEFQSTLIILIIFSFVGLGYFIFVKKYLLFWGQERLKFSEKKLKSLQESFSSFRELKIFNAEKKSLRQYSNLNNNFLKYTFNIEVLSKFPKLFFEIISIISFIFLIFFLISDTNDFSNILSIIGVFAVAAFKILPSISSLIVASQKFNYSFPSYEKVFKELETNNLKFKEKDIENYYLKFDDEIKINDLSFKYTNTEKLVLKNISFAIKINSSVGIYGVSGSGKSTLLDCLIGFNKPTDGSIFVDNQNINQSTKEWLKLISYVPQNIFLLDDTILSNIAIGDEIEKIDYKKLDLAISVSQLKNFIEELPQGKETIIGERGAKISGDKGKE